MKTDKGLQEIHEIMEKIYEDDKNLTKEQVVKKINDESDSFISKHKLTLKRNKPKDLIGAGKV
jgi:hypothetical protein